MNKTLAKLQMATTVVFFALLLAVSAAPTSEVEAAYACGDPYSGHCYGITRYQHDALGGSTDVGVVALQCAGCGGNFIDNEMWLNDFSAAAQADPNCNGDCWLEAGYFIVPSFGLGQTYFWAQTRYSVDGGNGFELHTLDPVPAGDYGLYTGIILNRYTYGYRVIISSSNYQQNIFAGSPTLAPNYIDRGMELSGTSGASAPAGRFARNKWRDTNGTWQYEDDNVDSYGVNSPIYASWVPGHLPSQDGLGGIWRTYCCLGQANTVESNPPTVATSSHMSNKAVKSLQGARAIQPTPGSVGMLSQQQVESYVKAHPLAGKINASGAGQQVQKVSLQSASKLNKELHLGVADDTMVYYVELSGKFAVTSPLKKTIEYGKAYEVFDAKTGNLLMMGTHNK